MRATTRVEARPVSSPAQEALTPGISAAAAIAAVPPTGPAPPTSTRLTPPRTSSRSAPTTSRTRSWASESRSLRRWVLGVCAPATAPASRAEARVLASLLGGATPRRKSRKRSRTTPRLVLPPRPRTRSPDRLRDARVPVVDGARRGIGDEAGSSRSRRATGGRYRLRGNSLAPRRRRR
jgi:hypothetical protein